MELVIFIGLQASGKSTFFRTYFADTHDLISKDLMRNNKNKERRQKQLIEMSFQAGRSVVVDNTNPTIETRSSLIAIGRVYNAEIIGYYFASDLNFCLERNSKRIGKARIPDVGIYTTFNKLVRPSYEEGFDRLFYVEIAEEEKFKIRDWL